MEEVSEWSLNVDSNKHLWSGPDWVSSALSLMVFTTEVLQKAAASTVAFRWWLFLIVQELRYYVYTLWLTLWVFVRVNYMLTDARVCKWVSFRRARYVWNIFWNSECEHHSCLQMPRIGMRLSSKYFHLVSYWKIIIRSLRSTKAAYNFSSASKPSEPLTAYLIQNIQISNHTRNKWLILTEEIWGEQYMILLKSINTHCTHTF